MREIIEGLLGGTVMFLIGVILFIEATIVYGG